MQFQVPQFIEMEDRIFGPLTFKQAIYVAGGGGLAFALLRIIPYPFNIPLALGAFGLGLAFAFVEIHKKPLVFFVAAAIWYFTHKRLYIWKRTKKQIKKHESKLPSENPIDIPTVSANKLKDLAWGLDINEHITQARLKAQLEKQKLSGPDAELKF